MLADYQPDELRFAYCYHVYLRWCTHRAQSHTPLGLLNLPILQSLAEPYSIRILECESAATEVRTLVSLQPLESVSACASKLKGKTSKWLREALQLERAADLLSKGYFACSCGKSERKQVYEYLQTQSVHHGYSERELPPILVVTYPERPDLESVVTAKHAFARLDFHLVLVTAGRHGVFALEEARNVAECWERLQQSHRFILRKLSFLPDHVHLAVRLHPMVCPAELVVTLMNSAQVTLWDNSRDSLLHALTGRVWQPSAYVGSFGDLATPKIQQYLRNWKQAEDDCG